MKVEILLLLHLLSLQYVHGIFLISLHFIRCHNALCRPNLKISLARGKPLFIRIKSVGTSRNLLLVVSNPQIYILVISLHYVDLLPLERRRRYFIFRFRLVIALDKKYWDKKDNL